MGGSDLGNSIDWIIRRNMPNLESALARFENNGGISSKRNKKMNRAIGHTFPRGLRR